MRRTYTPEDILADLDAAVLDFTFPDLVREDVELVASRLTAWRDTLHWVMIIEVLGWDRLRHPEDAFRNVLHCFGNCLIPHVRDSNLDALFPLDDDSLGGLFSEGAARTWWISEDAQPLVLGDLAVPVEFDREGFERAGVALTHPPRVRPVELFRRVAADHRERLLATDDQLEARFTRPLQRLFRLEAWNHPDVAAGVLPSASSTFVSLAQGLALGEPSLYTPAGPPNSHWR